MIPLIILAIEDPDDRAFMENLYMSYRGLMYSQVMGIVLDSLETDDIMQSAIEKLIDKLELLKAFGEADKVNYIITTCRRAAFSYLRKKRRVDYVVDESLDIVDDEADTPELWVLTKERMEYTQGMEAA